MAAPAFPASVFFFWDSQFGRFFNTGPIKGKGDPSFFLHTTLWAFLPWPVVLYVALVQFVRRGVRDAGAQEWFCISGALLTFLLFSASRFQLPHYLNIVFPFFAILTAQYLLGLKSNAAIRRIRFVQRVVIWLMLLAFLILFFLYKPPAAAPACTGVVAGVLAGMFVIRILLPGKKMQSILFLTAWASILVNLSLNLVFYPSLLTYQSGSRAAFWINKNNAARLPVAQLVYHQYAYALEFYLHQPLYTIDTVHNQYPAVPFLLYVYPPAKLALQKKGWQLQPVQAFAYYPVSRLQLGFINRYTRAGMVTNYELVLVQKK